MPTTVSAQAQFEYIAESLDSGIKEDLFRRGCEVTKALRNAELDVLAGSRSGKKYKSLPNRSSAPGEPPAAQSGALRREWNDSTNRSGNTVTSRIESNTGYAGYLEDGTRKMKSRPFVSRILEQAMPEVERINGEPYSQFISIRTKR